MKCSQTLRTISHDPDEATTIDFQINSVKFSNNFKTKPLTTRSELHLQTLPEVVQSL